MNSVFRHVFCHVILDLTFWLCINAFNLNYFSYNFILKVSSSYVWEGFMLKQFRHKNRQTGKQIRRLVKAFIDSIKFKMCETLRGTYTAFITILGTIIINSRLTINNNNYLHEQGGLYSSANEVQSGTSMGVNKGLGNNGEPTEFVCMRGSVRVWERNIIYWTVWNTHIHSRDLTAVIFNEILALH